MDRPTLRLERELLRSGARRLGAMDEVGRGSPAGPVTVGLVVVDASTGRPPPGIRDSKLLTPAAPPGAGAAHPCLGSWPGRLGSAGPGEVDELGVNGALGLAGARALAALDDAARPPGGRRQPRLADAGVSPAGSACRRRSRRGSGPT